MTEIVSPTTSAPSVSAGALDPGIEQYRRELTGYCYRMLGSSFEADDAVQETMVRAWKNLDRFEGRSSLRSWVYRIATNVCLDALNARNRRARPMDMGPASRADGPASGPIGEEAFVDPIADERVLPRDADPAQLAAERESIRLAFVAALQYLPPRQRAVLILFEVLRWHADEVAELLDTSVASVNSALQRARATLASRRVADTDTFAPLDDDQEALLTRYVEAFERYDIDGLIALLHEDATFSMPPWPIWLNTHDDIRGWYLGPGAECEGSVMVRTVANGSPAFAQYRDAGATPWALHVLEIDGGRIVGLNHFLDVERVFPAFGLPLRLGDRELEELRANGGRLETAEI